MHWVSKSRWGNHVLGFGAGFLTPSRVCSGGRCDRRVDEHEVFAETESERASKGLPVGSAFIPLAESPVLQAMVLQSRGGGRAVPSGTSSFPSGGDLSSSRGQGRSLTGSRGASRSASKGRSSSSASYGGSSIRSRASYDGAGGGGITSGLSLEEQVERGLIGVAEYHRLATASREAEERLENPTSSSDRSMGPSRLRRQLGADKSGNDNQVVLRSPNFGSAQGGTGGSNGDGLLDFSSRTAPPSNRNWMRERPSSRPGVNSGSRNMQMHK